MLRKFALQLTMTWLKNGKELPSVPVDEFRPLVLREVKASNGGEYRCQLRTRLGDYFDYNITGEPIEVSGKKWRNVCGWVDDRSVLV